MNAARFPPGIEATPWPLLRGVQGCGWAVLAWLTSAVLATASPPEEASLETKAVWLDSLAVAAQDHPDLKLAWEEGLARRKAYLHALEKAETRHRADFAAALGAVLKQHGLPRGLDLWGGAEQDLGLAPAAAWIERSDGLPSSLEVPRSICERLPARTRLAEQLGLGKHRFVYRHTYIDPEMKSRMPYGFAVACRIQFELHAQFHLSDDPEFSLPVSTHRLPTVIRYEVLGFNYGRGVKPHKRGLDTYQITAGDLENAWKKERLSQRLFTMGEGGVPQWNPEHSALSTRLSAQIEARLTELREEVMQALKASALETPDIFRDLDRCRETLIRALALPGEEVSWPELAVGLWSSERFLNSSMTTAESHTFLEKQGHRSALLLLAAMIDRAVSANQPDLARQWLAALTSHSLRPDHER